MKPAPFEYYAPASVEEALGHLAEHGWDAKVLAGGQSLIPMMNFRLAQPAILVDLNRIAALAFIRPSADGGVRLGAMTRQRDVEFDALVAERAPLIHEAMPKIAYPQIRTRGTVGGSLAHADPSAELVAASVALRARLRVLKRGGERWVLATDFFLGLFTTVLEPDELLVEAELPPLPARTGCAFLEVARRQHDFALVGAAAVATLDGASRCAEARLVYLSVGDGPVEAHGAASRLRGELASPELFREAAEVAAREDVDPVSDINASAAYRRHLVRVLGQRVLAAAFERADA